MIRFDDLFAFTWKEMNCGKVAAEGLRRLGLADAAEHVPVDQESGARAVQSAQSGEAAWKKVGADRCAATKRGDLLVYPNELGWHVSMLTDNPLYVLTSTLRRGPHLLRKSRVPSCEVYRWEGAK